jgi:glycogen phosphorylase
MPSQNHQVAKDLIELSTNLWWSWSPRARDIFSALDPKTWDATRENPVAVLQAVSQTIVPQDEGQLLDASAYMDAAKVGAALDAGGLTERAAEVVAEFEAYRAQPRKDCPSVAYFSLEFGLCAALPIYSGGLGVLAGDHTKAASDLGLDFTAVGLFYHQGYFQQTITEAGAQKTDFPTLNPAAAPMCVLRDEAGVPVTVDVPLGDDVVTAAVRHVKVGRVDLFLLDTHVEGASDDARELTARLYSGGNPVRIDQEILVGIGGVRLLRKIGRAPRRWHLNEGHCAFLALELVREHVVAGKTLGRAIELVRPISVFTTHTPVPAGHDRFGRTLVEGRLTWMADALGIETEDLMQMGRVGEGGITLSIAEPGEVDLLRAPPSDTLVEMPAITPADLAFDDDEDEDPDAPSTQVESEPLCMTVLALRLCEKANGVSMVHGEVSRQMWSPMWPDQAASDVPIGHVTNGIHIPTWMHGTAREHLEPHLPSDWLQRRDDPELWLDLAHGLDDTQIWAMRCALRANLLAFVQERAERRAARLGADTPLPRFTPDALTIGFARRFATYKRATMIFRDMERIVGLMTDADRPIQLVFAGKAHPMDSGGQALIAQLVSLAGDARLEGRVCILEDYDMVMGRALVSGVDVWLNNPRKPREASGTSGQKVAMHGGLNLSVLDGWWPEGYDGVNGFAIGDATSPVNPEAQDDRDARALYTALETQVIPLYFDRDENGVPRRWVRRIRHAMASLVGRFSTRRMVTDYADNFYR